MPNRAPSDDTSHVYHPTSAACWIRLATLSAAAFSLGTSIAYAQDGAQRPAVAEAPSPFSYADIADLAKEANLIAIARPRSFAKVPFGGSPPPAGTQRYYVDAQVDSLIRGDSGIPPRIAFLLDLPLGMKPTSTMRGKRFLLFGRSGEKPGDVQLLSSQALLPSSPATDAKVRAITAELMALNAPPEIVRVAEAFHVEGTIAGESETQIFLATQGGRPVSLSVIRRPNMEPRLGAALGEIVDEAADVPARDTLLWYRLACGLPRTLPSGATAKLDPSAATAAAGDYGSFIDRLGPCERTRTARGSLPTLGNPADGS